VESIEIGAIRGRVTEAAVRAVPVDAGHPADDDQRCLR
jgi:hypothetical protein